jgi:RHS repeat-associated protein
MKNMRIVCGLVLMVGMLLAPLTVQARYLNPETGRFQTMDSYEGNSSDPQSLHKYLYAHADPVNGTDPSGKFTLIELLVVNGAITGPLRAQDARVKIGVGARLARYAILGVGVVGGVWIGWEVGSESPKDPELTAAIKIVEKTIEANRDKILAYCRQHNLDEYDGSADIPGLQRIRQSRWGKLYSWFDFPMYTTPPPHSTTFVSADLVKDPYSNEMTYIPLLAHEYGHVVLQHLSPLGGNEDEAVDFQDWFMLEFFGIDTGP